MASRRPATGRQPGGSTAATSTVTAAAKSGAGKTSGTTRERPGTDRTASTLPSAAVSQPAAAAAARTRSAKLRLVHVDPLSVMKIAFLLSIAVGIIAIVAVMIIWGVLGAAGVWDSINHSVQQTVGSDSSKPFDITDYLGTGRVVGFTMIAAVIDVIVMTALATLGAFVYNLAATLLGGVEMTYAEDR